MKRFFLLWLLILCGQLFSQSYYNYNVQVIEDEFEDYKIIRMYGNYLPDSKWLPTNSLLFNAQKFTDENNNHKYQFFVEWLDDEWLFIDEGETLILLIDGERVRCKGYGSHKNRQTLEGGAIRETAVFEASIELFNRIANAKVVKIKLVGQSKDIIRELDEDNIENYRKFVEELTKG
ncbi:MAG: hypothetical protein KF816_11495 [Melioribacteraceae bacterium]|nr:hypothetical protein [Melioribacteraceae bacterium]